MGRLINANGLSATALDHSAEAVESLRKFGWPTPYGDVTRLDLLTAGAASARVIVVVIDDVDQSLKVWTWCASTSRRPHSWRERAT